MPQPPAPRKTPGRPPRISREEVVGTARRIVDSEGVARLTMRRLAAEIGSTPMALYHHVRNKEELLVLLLDDYAARTLHRPGCPPSPASGSSSAPPRSTRRSPPAPGSWRC